MPNPNKCVYVASNASHPNLLKIGMTTVGAEKRVKQLNATALPYDYKVEATIPCSNPAAVERHVHNELRSRRHRRNREFFRIDVSTATKAIEHAVSELEGPPKPQHRGEQSRTGRTEDPKASGRAASLELRNDEIFRNQVRAQLRDEAVAELRAVQCRLLPLREAQESAAKLQTKPIWPQAAITTFTILGLTAGGARFARHFESPVTIVSVVMLLLILAIAGGIARARAKRTKLSEAAEHSVTQLIEAPETHGLLDREAALLHRIERLSEGH